MRVFRCPGGEEEEEDYELKGGKGKEGRRGSREEGKRSEERGARSRGDSRQTGWERRQGGLAG